MNRKAILTSALLLTLALLAVLIWKPWSQSGRRGAQYAFVSTALVDAPSVLALDSLKERGLTPVPFVTGRETVQALTGDAAFASTMAEWPFLLASQNRDDLRVLAVITSAHSMGVLADRAAGITSPSDLAGKRVGFPQGTSAQYLFESYFRSRSLLDKVVPVNLPPPQLQPLLERGDIQAMVIWQPVLEKARSARPDDLFFLPDSQTTFRVVYCVVSTEDNIREHPAAVRVLLEALIEAEAALNTRSPEAMTTVAEASGLDPKTLETLLPLFEFRVHLDNRLIEVWEELASWANESGIASEEITCVDWRAHIHDEALRSIDPRRVNL